MYSTNIQHYYNKSQELPKKNLNKNGRSNFNQ